MDKPIRLICGLGNPGAEYELTRHNCGFLAVDAIAGELDVSYWKSQDGCQAGVARLDGRELVLVKPQSFMNTSGGPLSKAMRRYEVGPDEILVIHDDLDIPAGTLRFKRKGGHGGHNGLRSISNAIGPDYARLKVGIGRPPGRMDPADYVLAQIPKSAREDFLALTAQAGDAALLAARRGLDAAMLEYHTSSE